MLAIVKLVEGPRVFARVTDTKYEELRVGQKMRLAWAMNSAMVAKNCSLPPDD